MGRKELSWWTEDDQYRTDLWVFSKDGLIRFSGHFKHKPTFGNAIRDRSLFTWKVGGGATN